MDHVLDRDGAHRTVELRIAERQSSVVVDVVNDVTAELWVVRHLLRVQTQAHDGARAKARREMAAPATHQIEQTAARGQNPGVQGPERGDRAVVDVHDLARNDVEAIVRRLVVTREGHGREQAVPRGLVHAALSCITWPSRWTTAAGPRVR